MKVLLDLDQLLKENKITSEQALQLKKLAIKETGSTAINLLLAFGAIAIAAGTFAFNFNYYFGLLIGCTLIGAGYYILYAYHEQWGLLGSVLNLTGALFIAVSLFLVMDSRSSEVYLIIAALFLIIGFTTPNRLLIVLSPFAIAGAIGSSTFYEHAMYGLVIEKPIIDIILFSILAFGAFMLGKEVPHYTVYFNIFSRVCVILVNFGFWVGSLWGDSFSKHSANMWNAQPDVPPIAFAIAWAIALLALGAWAAKEERRFIFNTVAVFASIHFYTQWFEYLGFHPLSVLLSGCLMIIIAISLWKYNKSILK